MSDEQQHFGDGQDDYLKGARKAAEAARKAGCKGGTLLKARELESGEDKKLFGLTLSQEKSILLILTPNSQKQSILRAICETVLKETGEHALAVSLPVEQVEGIQL